MPDVLKKFGKYFLLDLVAQGGMAEVYRARMATPDGGARLVAIKRILTTYSENPEFVGMFKSEIKTTSGFAHPNIVQIYDFGEEGSQLYLAMEMVDGRNMRQFISRSIENKTGFPIEISTYIIEQAAAALAYAHNYSDRFTGKRLNIVHRDISPQNILISYDGAVKVIDFGIAKAVTNIENTRAGVIKGKPSYLSPEQISGETLDGRSDVFALGVVMWEVLTGRKLFASDNDYGVLKLIENCTNHVKPPSLYNSKIPKELDAIVLKSLAKDRNQRYQSAEEMHRMLHKFLYQFASDFNPADLAYFAKGLFKNEIVEDRKRLQQLNDKVEKLIKATEVEEAKIQSKKAETAKKTIDDEHTEMLSQKADKNVPPPPPDSPEKTSGSFRVVDFKKASEKTDIRLDFKGGEASPSAGRNTISYAPANLKSTSSNRVRTSTTLSRPPGPTKRAGPLQALLVLFAVIGGGYYAYENYFVDRQVASLSESGDAVLTIDGNVSSATVLINGKARGNELPLSIKKLPSERPLKVTVKSNGYHSFEKNLVLKSGKTEQLYVELERESDEGSSEERVSDSTKKYLPIRISISPSDAGAPTQIRLNGSDIDALTHVGKAPLDVPLELVVEREGYRNYKKRFVITSSNANGLSEYIADVVLVPAKFGFLSIKTIPSSDAVITVDGEQEKVSTPITRKRLPVGMYKIKLMNTILGMEKIITVEILEDRFTNIEERLSVTNKRQPGSD